MELAEKAGDNVIGIAHDYIRLNPQYKGLYVVSFTPTATLKKQISESSYYKQIIQDNNITAPSKWVEFNILMKQFGLHYISSLNVVNMANLLRANTDTSHYIIVDEDKYLMFKLMFTGGKYAERIYKQLNVNIDN